MIDIKTGGVVAPYKEFENTIIQPNDRVICCYPTTTLNIVNINLPESLYVIFGNSADETHYTAGMQFVSPVVISSVTLINRGAEPMILTYSVGVGGIVDNRLNISGNVAVINTNETAVFIKEKKYKWLSSQREVFAGQFTFNPDMANKTRLHNIGTAGISLYTSNGVILEPAGVEELTLSEPFIVYGSSTVVFERFE